MYRAQLAAHQKDFHGKLHHFHGKLHSRYLTKWESQSKGMIVYPHNRTRSGKVEFPILGLSPCGQWL